jgi:hypothetical protein
MWLALSDLRENDRMDKSSDEFRNALPNEVDDRPDSGMPRQLRTQADNERTLTLREAEAAGITGVDMVYGETSADENREDQRDAHRADKDEHV